MSLVCCECDDNVEPGMVFPGREGGMLNESTASGVGVAVCFECIFRACGTDKAKVALRRVFACYNAEVEYNRFRAQYHGFVSDGVPEGKQLKDSLESVQKTIPAGCLCCERVLVGTNDLFFTFRVMDRVHGESRKSFFGSYQWSFIKTGETSFHLCSDCVQAHLPRPTAFLVGAKMPPSKTPQGNEIVMLDELSQEQIDHVNKLLPKGIRYIG